MTGIRYSMSEVVNAVGQNGSEKSGGGTNGILWEFVKEGSQVQGNQIKWSVCLGKGE